jgi:hypothetical protein
LAAGISPAECLETGPQYTRQSSRFERVLQNYANVIAERDAVLLREKTAREQFEASFRATVANVILPAATQVKELVTPTSWMCVATKSDNGLFERKSRSTRAT